MAYDPVHHTLQITKNVDIQDLFNTHGHHVCPKMICVVRKKVGRNPSYGNFLNAKILLLTEFFGKELEKYEWILIFGIMAP